VATVVTKLLNAVAPNTAYFGEKDYQQLLVVRQLAAALLLRTEIVGCPTVREEDGLARSSRNAQLSKTEREAAPVLYRALVAGAPALSREEPEGAETEMAEVVAKEPLAELDYAVVRDAATLGAPGEGPRRLLIAARVGPVRLIDNLAPEQVVGLH
jgi:pantoate--beta-alanine ligase